MDGLAIRARLAEARLYLCTDARADRGDLAEFVDAALAGGVDIVQLRDKGTGGPLEARQELAALEVLDEACRRHGALLAVNDRADVALAAGAQVLHLGQDDLPVRWARRLLGADVVIGRSTHNAAQAVDAAGEPGVDYFCVGPCWTTPTKPGRPAAGLDLVRSVRSSPANPVTANTVTANTVTASTVTASTVAAARPWFAIGGIETTQRLEEVLAAGAERVVVVRAITEAPDPQAAAAAFAQRLRAG